MLVNSFELREYIYDNVLLFLVFVFLDLRIQIFLSFFFIHILINLKLGMLPFFVDFFSGFLFCIFTFTLAFNITWPSLKKHKLDAHYECVCEKGKNEKVPGV